MVGQLAPGGPLWLCLDTPHMRRLAFVRTVLTYMMLPSQWCHNEHDGVANHRRLYCLLNRCSDADQRKHQSSVSLAFVRGIHRSPVNSPHKGPVTRKMFPFDDVITRQTDARKSATITQTIPSHRVNMVSHELYHAVYTLRYNQLAGQDNIMVVIA